MDWDKASVDLSKKLAPSAVKPAKQFGPKGDYLEGWFCIQEANRIFGFGGWSYTILDCRVVQEKPREIGRDKKPGFGVTYVATVRVTVGDVIREDVGSGHGYDVDLGLAHESAIKEGVTDALKRSLRSFGNPFGLALYDKSRENVGVDEPPFDAAAEAASLIARLESATSLAELGALWKSNAADIAAVKDADAAAYSRIEMSKNAMKHNLQPKEQAA